MAGWIKVRRSIWDDHPVLGGDTFSRREAWLYLVARAATETHQRRIGSDIVTLHRGEVLASLRSLGSEWGWSKTKVSVFFENLQSADMLVSKLRTASGQVYLVADYESYAGGDEAEKDKERTDVGTSGGQAKRKRKAPEPKPDEPAPERGGWVGKAGDMWVDKFGGTISYAKVGKALKPLAKTYGENDILEGWAEYLASKKIGDAFKTPASFAEKFGVWYAARKGPGPQPAVGVEDVKRLIAIGGSFLWGGSEARKVAFSNVREKDAELWAKVGPLVERLDWVTLGRAQNNSFELDRALKHEMERHARAA
jgi:hypothetical protein